MNIECDQVALDELESNFRFNDAILRSMTLLQKSAITEVSMIATSTAEENKIAESRAKDAAARDASALAAGVGDDLDEDLDADDIIPEQTL
jgi:small subunit ribosomal protein S6